MSVDSVYLQITNAKKFIAEKNIDFDDRAIEISDQMEEKEKQGVKKGYLYNAIESNGYAEEFVDKYWPKAKTKAGQARIEKYKRSVEKNEFLLNLDNEEKYDIESEMDIAFELEHQLRDFLAHNINSLDVNGRKLKLFVDSQERNGIEYPTEVGPIDILAVDDNNDFYVLELKRSRSPDKAIGQVARYMGWLNNTIGRHQKVFGIIVAKEISENLKYAVSALPNVSLFEYSISFSLKHIAGYARKG